MIKYIITITVLFLFSLSSIGQNAELDNLRVRNKINLKPVRPADHKKFKQEFGDLYVDAVDSTFYLYDGKRLVAIPKGDPGYNELTITYPEDTVSFDPLTNYFAFGIVTEVTSSNLNATDATIKFEETYNMDSSYVYNSSVFPYTIDGNKVIRFLDDTALQYTRVIIDWGANTAGQFYIRRYKKITY